MPDDHSLIEIPIKASAEFGVSKQEKRIVTDHRNFPPRTNKIEEVGSSRGANFS